MTHGGQDAGWESGRSGPTGATTSLALAADEHIYGFGDKRAALDQRGNKVEMLNRDAFASENNESYKSIPFYMSSAGYGLFFHNFYPVGVRRRRDEPGPASAHGHRRRMDFYVFVGEPKEVSSQYTELTGRPAMLPRWAFGYHQGKASYEGRDAFTVAAEMRRREAPDRRHLLRRLGRRGDQEGFHRFAVEAAITCG